MGKISRVSAAGMPQLSPQGCVNGVPALFPITVARSPISRALKAKMQRQTFATKPGLKLLKQPLESLKGERSGEDKPGICGRDAAAKPTGMC